MRIFGEDWPGQLSFRHWAGEQLREESEPGDQHRGPRGDYSYAVGRVALAHGSAVDQDVDRAPAGAHRMVVIVTHLARQGL